MHFLGINYQNQQEKRKFPKENSMLKNLRRIYKAKKKKDKAKHTSDSLYKEINEHALNSLYRYIIHSCVKSNIHSFRKLMKK